MTRGTVRYNSGNIPAGSDNVTVLHSRIRTELEAHQSNGTDSWTEEDVLDATPATYESVYHSVGDRSIGALSVSDATNATPIVVTTTANHQLSTGQYVDIFGVLGNTAANGRWVVTVTGATTFSLDTSVGNGAYTSGGVVETPWIGDTDLWLHIHRTAPSDLDFVGYQDWSSTSSTGARASSTTQVAWNSLSATAEIDWYTASNEYEFVFIIVQSGAWRVFYACSPIRIQGPNTAGIGRVKTATSTTGTVVIATDRDMSSEITPGQRVWLVNQTVEGATLDSSAYTEIVPVSAVTSTTITVTGVTNQPYRVGSLIGLDCCMFALGYATSGDPPMYWTNRPDAGYSSAGAQVGAIEHIGPLIDESSEDPRPDNDYLMSDALIRSTQASYVGLRGFCEVIAYAAQGVQTDADRMLPDHQTSSAFKVFASLSHTNWSLGIGGPGAGVT